MTASLTAGGIGLLLAGVVVVLIWKKHGKKPPGKLAFLAGLFASGTVLGWLGGWAFSTVAGTAITLIVLVIGGAIFWLEAVKGNGHHWHRTPAIAFAVGVALTATFGGVHSMVEHSSTQVTSFIHSGTGR